MTDLRSCGASRYRQTNQSDIVLVDKRRKIAVLIDVAIPTDSNIRKKEDKKLDKYRGIKKMCRVKATVVPMVFRALKPLSSYDQGHFPLLVGSIISHYGDHHSDGVEDEEFDGAALQQQTDEGSVMKILLGFVKEHVCLLDTSLWDFLYLFTLSNTCSSKEPTPKLNTELKYERS